MSKESERASMSRPDNHGSIWLRMSDAIKFNERTCSMGGCEAFFLFLFSFFFFENVRRIRIRRVYVFKEDTKGKETRETRSGTSIE